MKKIVITLNSPPELLQCLTKELKKDYEVHLVKTPKKIQEIDPDVVILDHNVHNVIEVCKPTTHIVYISSKHVFKPSDVDYKYTDAPNNNNKYLQDLIEAEVTAKKAQKLLLIRHDDLYTKDQLIDLEGKLKNDQEYVFDNSESWYPIYIPYFVQVIKSLIDLEATEVIHIRGIEKVTQYLITKAIADYFKIKHRVNSVKLPTLGVIKLSGIVLPAGVRSIVRKYYEENKNVKH